MPFMNLGITILYTKPVKQDPNLFSFLSPLSLGVWIYMVTAYLAVSLLLYMLARVSPYERGHQVSLSWVRLGLDRFGLVWLSLSVKRKND
jgi:hypothetical protein